MFQGPLVSSATCGIPIIKYSMLLLELLSVTDMDGSGINTLCGERQSHRMIVCITQLVQLVTRSTTKIIFLYRKESSLLLVISRVEIWEILFFFLAAIVLISVLALVDIERQQNLAEEFARNQMIEILSDRVSLTELGFPQSLLDSHLERADTNYTFTQWEVIFSIEKGGYVQVYTLLIPIFRFFIQPMSSKLFVSKERNSR